jgi:hypothetical protein
MMSPQLVRGNQCLTWAAVVKVGLTHKARRSWARLPRAGRPFFKTQVSKTLQHLFVPYSRRPIPSRGSGRAEARERAKSLPYSS